MKYFSVPTLKKSNHIRNGKFFIHKNISRTFSVRVSRGGEVFNEGLKPILSFSGNKGVDSYLKHTYTTEVILFRHPGGQCLGNETPHSES